MRAFAIAALTIAMSASPAWAQSVSLRADSRDLYAGLPFVLSVQAQGFDEAPEPQVSGLEIPGARVTYLGASPSVSSMVTVINGRRSERRDVTHVFRFRVEAAAPGVFSVPPVTVQQGARSVQSRPSTFRVQDLAPTGEMQVRLVLPDRPIWVGETFDVKLDWYLRRDVSSRTFVVPLFDMQEWVTVEPAAGPAGDSNETLSFPAGSRELELPYERETAVLDGVEYTRFRFSARATAQKEGTHDLAPTRVVAQLQVGTGRDAFGFPAARMRLFKAEDAARRLEVRPLPASNRPASFKNAVGADFSLEVQADRTVVRVGDPIELRLLVRGKGRLEGLLLADLAAVGLSPALFALPSDPPGGELLDDGKGKLFRAAVRLKSTDAREIPALSFSYFDPATATYQTARSQPIALSVQGQAVVGAGDVVSSAAPVLGVAAPAPNQAAVSLVGADLTLSAEEDTLDRALSPADVRPVVAALYGLPILLLAARLWRARTAGRRNHDASVRRALRTVEEELERAVSLPARESAPRLAHALCALARRVDRAADADLIARLETGAFAPGAADRPLDEPLCDEAQRQARSLARERRAGQAPASTATLAILCVTALSLAAWRALAEPQHARLQAAREAYRQALADGDRERRTQAFRRAESLLGELAVALPDRPALQVDWGNAALGAQDLGHAALAYRRALALDPGEPRARKNLAWARKRAPEWLPRPPSGGAVESLFFWHYSLAAAKRHLAGAAAFAVALVLFAARGRARGLARLAPAPLLLWAAMTTSLAVERDTSGDAVITGDAAVLRAADSHGAPQALAHPLPPGAEVNVVEVRDQFARVRLADGAVGWLPASALERVAPP